MYHKTMKKTILLFLIAILFVSCEENETIEPILKTDRIEIGTWNMQETASKWNNVYYADIVEISCFIFADEPEIVPVIFTGWQSSINNFKGEILHINNQIILKRTDNCLFDSEFYNSQEINRGYIVIKYY